MNSIWEQIRDWVVLGILLVFSLIFLFTQNEPLVQSLRSASMQASAQIESGFSWVGNYFRALDENSELRAENVALSSELARSREALQENQQLRRMIELRDTTDLNLHPARIVSKELTRQRNLFSIDAGIEQGVEVGMAVITDRGILGTVVLVSRNYARVLPYLNTDFRTPVKIQELQTDGIVRWEGDRSDQLLMEHVSRTEPVLRGQLVVTSGYSRVFPPGLAVGYVDSLSSRPGRNEYRIYVRPTSPYHQARNVFVVRQRPDPELASLEAEEIR